MAPLTYITPQVQNGAGNIIVDTTSWVAITGTFIATGNEKYMVIGNFKHDNNTMRSQIQTTVSYAWCDLNLDEVSCMPLNLTAYAGPDQFKPPGDSTFIGRTPDVGIDEACQWFKLPNMTTAFDTVAGLWVKPNITTTYVVRQEICGNVKWDTVIIFMNPVGEELRIKNYELKIFPSPASDQLQIEISDNEVLRNYDRILIFNNLNQLVWEEKLLLDEHKQTLNLELLPNGIYFLRINGEGQTTVTRRFVVQK